jgi:hypothetical protein
MNLMSRLRRVYLVFRCVGLLLVVGCAVQATTLVRLSVAQMSRVAHAVVRARCVENSTGWDAGEIWTFTSFEVQELWQGSAPPRITVRLLGGRAGNLTSSVSGVPRFRVGEEVVLFLEKTPRGDFSVISWEQGTFRIRRSAATGSESVTQDSASFATFEPATREFESATREFESAGIRNLPIETFRAQVDAAVNAEAGRKQ